MKTVNLEEIFQKYSDEFVKSDSLYSKRFYIAAMREACHQTVELCADNARLFWIDLEQTQEDIDQDSILNTKSQII